MGQLIISRFTARYGSCRRLPRRHAVLRSALLVIALGRALAQAPPTQKEITEGYLPYHHLLVEDFPISDADRSPEGMYTYGFRHYSYRYVTVRKDGGFSARVTEWSVRCGFDRNKSWRKSWFKSFNEILPHEQGHLDISILYSTRLAHTKLDRLPTGEGESVQAAADNLKTNLDALVARTSKEAQAEQDVYDTETSHGANRAKQREWTSTIQKRLKEVGIKYSN
jgi:hypothetical protein